MDPLTQEESVALADQLAHDLLTLAQRNQIPPKDLVMALAMTQKLLQTVLYPGDELGFGMALHEADATYTCMSKLLRAN